MQKKEKKHWGMHWGYCIIVTEDENTFFSWVGKDRQI